MDDTWVWKVKLRGGKIKFEPVIYDGKVILPGSQPQSTSLGATVATLPGSQDYSQETK